MITPNWQFDAPSGCWKDAAFSAEVLHWAELASRWKAKEFATPRRIGEMVKIAPLGQPEYELIVSEFGRAFTLPVSDTLLRPLVMNLAAVLPKVELWARLPELRRADDKGAPGATIAWYGIGGMRMQTIVPGGALFVEGEALPIEPACAKPKTHADDCECAML